MNVKNYAAYRKNLEQTAEVISYDPKATSFLYQLVLAMIQTNNLYFSDEYVKILESNFKNCVKLKQSYCKETIMLEGLDIYHEIKLEIEKDIVKNEFFLKYFHSSGFDYYGDYYSDKVKVVIMGKNEF